MSLLSKIGRQVFEVGTDAAKVRVSVLGQPLEEGVQGHITRVLTGLIEDSPEVARSINKVRVVNRAVTEEGQSLLTRAAEAFPDLTFFDHEIDAGLRQQFRTSAQGFAIPADFRRIQGSPRKKTEIELSLPNILERFAKQKPIKPGTAPESVITAYATSPAEHIGLTLTHEYAHAVDGLAMERKIGARHMNRFELFANNNGLGPAREVQGFSTYGYQNPMEGFAETFTQMRVDPSVVPEGLRKKFKESTVLKQIYNQRNNYPFITGGPPGRRVLNRDPNFGASIASVVGEKNSKNWVVPNAAPFKAIPKLLSKVGKLFKAGEEVATSIPIRVIGQPLEDIEKGLQGHITQLVDDLVKDSPKVAKKIDYIRLSTGGVGEQASLGSRLHFLHYKELTGDPDSFPHGYAMFGIDNISRGKGGMKGLSLKQRLSFVGQRLRGNDIVSLYSKENKFISIDVPGIVSDLKMLDQEWSESTPYLFSQNTSSVGEALAVTLSHEYGHFVGRSLTKSATDKKMIRAVEKALPEMTPSAVGKISAYATENIEEAFAETFAAMRHQPSVVPEELRKAFEKSSRLKKIYNPRSSGPLFTGGPPGQRVLNRDPNFGAKMADVVGEKNSKNWVIPNAAPFPPVRGGLMKRSSFSSSPRMITPDTNLLSAPRHSSARSGLAIRSSATGVFLR